MMPNEKLNRDVEDILREILDADYEVDAAVKNLKSMKHQYNKDNLAFINAILPAFFNFIGGVIFKPSTKLAEKKPVLQKNITLIKDLITSFVQTQDDQLEAVFLIALSCSKIETLRNTFNLLVQLFYQSEILTGSAILKWYNSPSSSIRLDEESEEEELTEKIDQKVLEKFK